MDGVLLDSEPLHHEVVNEILREEGRAALSAAEYSQYLGVNDVDTWQDLIRRHALNGSLLEYRERYYQLVLESYRQNSVIAPGAVTLLDALTVRGLRLAVASSSRRVWVEACLGALEIRHYFDVVVDGDMVAHGKPDPAIFLLAAQLLGIDAEACFVVEDSPKGIAAGLAAGMRTVAVATRYTPAAAAHAAHIQIRGLDEFDYSFLAAPCTRC
jgi:HAD superfamily hydrolase (TIGR01509 family)